MSNLKQVKRLDLEYLANLLKNQDDDRAIEILEEYAKKHMVDGDALQEILSINWNCCMCSSCGRYFGEDEFSSNDEDCCYCNLEQ